MQVYFYYFRIVLNLQTQMRMSLNKIFALLIFVLVANSTLAQVTICGKVGCEDDDARDIQILLEKTQWSVMADSSGKYCLSGITSGEYTMIAFASGHIVQKKVVKVSNQDLEVNFSLKPEKRELDAVYIIKKKDNNFGIGSLSSIEGTSIYDGKKTEVITLDQLTFNTASNNARQAFSKISGLNIWENDCAGIQLGIGARGLSPNRTANFNVRQNGYDISADALGYPESYYTPPLEAIDKIEFVRGAASLQYGTQLGGMINFVFKKAPVDKKIEFTTRNTGGSYGFLNTFNSIGGTVGKLSYYGFYQYKQGNCWRPNSGFNAQIAYSQVQYKFNQKLSVNAEYTYMNYLAQQPGGLTDAEFKRNPQNSIRARNWFKVNWNLLSLSFDYKLSENTQINWRNFMLLASRKAVGSQEKINVIDLPGNRVYQNDDYLNFGSELRLLHRYKLAKQKMAFVIGQRVYRGKTNRQQGDGNSLSGPDFYFINPDNVEKFDYQLPSQNYALFAENIFHVGPRFTITPGIRIENIQTYSNGYTRNIVKDRSGNVLVDNKVFKNNNNIRTFILFGIGSSFKVNESIELYANYTTNYRAATFSDLIVSNPNIQVDSLLKDEFGYNADIGLRGNWKEILYFDVNLFYLRYTGRIGETFLPSGQRFRTNIGNSKTQGLESILEIDLLKLINKSSKNSLSIFLNNAINQAVYLASDDEAFNRIYANNRVELVPLFTHRSGITYKRGTFAATFQYSHIASQFTDATNSITPSSSAIVGEIPSYQVFDLSIKYEYKRYMFGTGINNIADSRYFTRRADGYPGPGIIPADPRTMYLSLGLRL